jgi:hypothetical protein
MLEPSSRDLACGVSPDSLVRSQRITTYLYETFRVRDPGRFTVYLAVRIFFIVVPEAAVVIWL